MKRPSGCCLYETALPEFSTFAAVIFCFKDETKIYGAAVLFSTCTYIVLSFDVTTPQGCGGTSLPRVPYMLWPFCCIQVPILASVSTNSFCISPFGIGPIFNKKLVFRP